MIQFDKSVIEKIENTLSANAKFEYDHYRFALVNNEDYERRLSLEIHNNMKEYDGALIVVYTPNTHFQLHHCNKIEIADSLGEVTFISEGKEVVSAIVVEETGGCSLYSNVDRDILSGDYQQLSVEVMLAGVAQGLSEES